MIRDRSFAQMQRQSHRDTKQTRAISPRLGVLVVKHTRTIALLVSLLVPGIALSVTTLPAAETPAAVQDLGDGLSYLRLRQLPDDAAALTAAWTAPALVVDLRYTGGTDALAAELPPRAPAAPLFVLVGPGTPRAVLATLRHAAPGLITLGLAAPDLQPDLALDCTPAADRRAYDALDSGTPVDALISVKETKQRFDEAALNREHEKHLDGTAAPAADQPAEPAAPGAVPAGDTAAAAAKPPAPPEPPVDEALQRAVQLHRALAVLKKLPPA